MTFFAKQMLVNAAAAGASSLAALLGIYVFCRPDLDLFLEWIVQAAGVLIFGLVVQNFANLYWLQREKVIARWSPGDTQDFLFETVVELIHFPFKTVALTAALWIFLGMPAAMLYWISVDGSSGNALVVYAFLLASGSIVSFIQDSYSRYELYPKLEVFLEKQDESLQRRLASMQNPFTVRAKLILQSSFSLIVIVIVVLAAGYALARNRLRDEQTQALQTLLSTAEPALTAAKDGSGRDRVGQLVEMLSGTAHGSVSIAFTGGETVSRKHTNDPGLDRVLAMATKENAATHPDWLVATHRGSGYSAAAVIPWSDFSGELGTYIYLFGISFSSGCLLIFMIAFLASHDLSRSVHRIEKWAEQLGAGVFHFSPPVPEDDQIAELVFRLDALKSRLATLLIQMERGAVGTRTISGRVQEHAVLLRQTTEEDNNLIALTATLLERMRQSLREHQKTIVVLAKHAEEAVTGTMQMGPILREVDANSEKLTLGVESYSAGLQELESLVIACRDDLSAFVVGAEEAKRSILNLDEVLDHLIETVRRSKTVVFRATGQSSTTYESTHRTRAQIQQLEETMSDSSTLLVHLSRTMSDLKIVASSIHEVAEDTKLLSLNAAIRSVKAKDEGRSFSVISHTIQNLAADTQHAIHQLMMEIEELMAESSGLDSHVASLSDSLKSATDEAEGSTDVWRQTRSDVQSFGRLEQQFEQFVVDLRRYRDDIRVRHGKFESQAHYVSRLLSDLSHGLEQRRHQIQDIHERSEQIRNYASYEVSKGRYAADHLEQIRSMSTHIQNFLVEQLRSVTELEQTLGQLQSGMQLNVSEAREISDGLKRLERAIRRFEEAFGQFRFGDEQTGVA